MLVMIADVFIEAILKEHPGGQPSEKPFFIHIFQGLQACTFVRVVLNENGRWKTFP